MNSGYESRFAHGSAFKNPRSLSPSLTVKKNSHSEFTVLCKAKEVDKRVIQAPICKQYQRPIELENLRSRMENRDLYEQLYRTPFAFDFS